VSKSAAGTLTLVTGGLLIVYALLDARNGRATPEVTYKRIYSSFLATVALGVAADLVPELVGPFAILIIVAAYAKHKGALGSVIGAPATNAAGATTAHNAQGIGGTL
jgi:hypothetical protein